VGKLYLVRHADAGHRGHGSAPDEERELTDRGWRQAEGLCTALAGLEITRLLTSPFARCVQTLEPLGKVLGLPVEADDRLAERAGAAGALAVAAEVRGTDAVLCSHGDVIPEVLDHLLAQGTKLKGELRWQKASTWILTWDGKRLSKGRYLPPPA
jgi:broad specificity phosphatase PhoE